MKFTRQQIDKYLNDFHIELNREQLEKDWFFDKTQMICMLKGNVKFVCLKTKEKDWIRIEFDDLSREQRIDLCLRRYRRGVETCIVQLMN